MVNKCPHLMTPPTLENVGFSRRNSKMAFLTELGVLRVNPIVFLENLFFSGKMRFSREIQRNSLPDKISCSKKP